MAAELVETSKLFARTIATINPKWIEPLARNLCKYTYTSPHWEKKKGQVVAFEKVSLFGLPLINNRKVNYARIKSSEAREIFIQTALVQGDFGQRCTFLEKNIKLISSVEGIEDRVRQRDILVDDYTLFTFYNERIPDDVLDRASLNRFLKQSPDQDFLIMTEEDILNKEPETEELDAFPEKVTAGEFSLPLSYRFEPGQQEDGVTVSVPVHVLPHLSQDKFDWLVPGMLFEKVAFLLKGLPKAIRKHLIPIPQTAKEILVDFDQSTSLYVFLERAIYKRYRIRISRSQWPTETLPDHLKMRFSLVNDQGKELKKSRSLRELMSKDVKAKDTGLIKKIRAKWERDSIAEYDFDKLPERIPITGGDGLLHGFLYPGLVIESSQSVALTLFEDRDECRNESRKALSLLYRLQFTKQCKAAKKDFSLPRSYWALYEGVGSHEEINEDMETFIFECIFQCRSGKIPEKSFYEEQIEKVKKEGLFNLGQIYKKQVVHLLQERRAVLDYIGEVEKRTGGKKLELDLYRSQVARLLPPHFLRRISEQRLRDVPRYLKTIQIRLERRLHNPEKDDAKAEQLKVYEDRLNTIEKKEDHNEDVLELIKEYSRMIEEFKISLFAQEIKTAFPISAKRLEKKWFEIEGLL